MEKWLEDNELLHFIKDIILGIFYIYFIHSFNFLKQFLEYVQQLNIEEKK